MDFWDTNPCTQEILESISTPTKAKTIEVMAAYYFFANKRMTVDFITMKITGPEGQYVEQVNTMMMQHDTNILETFLYDYERLDNQSVIRDMERFLFKPYGYRLTNITRDEASVNWDITTIKLTFERPSDNSTACDEPGRPICPSCGDMHE